nr:nitrilase-related carbon-nitrogen hydrolase [Nocardia brasiliensis]
MGQITVAAVQATSENGAVERNLRNAALLVREAARRGARVVLCPEFLAAGYIYRESIWESGEPQGGATESWLANCSAEYVRARCQASKGGISRRRQSRR